jgi:hypothetical protein
MLRAARSLYTNRAKLTAVERRIEHASQELTTYLALAGVTVATIGAYEVQLEDEAVLLTYNPLPGASQLPLPDVLADDPEGSEAEDRWATPATAAVAHWIIDQPDIMDESGTIVESAGDVVTGAAKLHAWVIEQAWQKLVPEIEQTTSAFGYKARLQRERLERALGTVDWVSLADSLVQREDWAPLTGEQHAIVRALLPKRQVLQAEGQPSLDPEVLLARAAAGKLPCPQCTEPLEAEQFDLLGTPVVRLYCLGTNCTFEEI